MSLDRQTQGQQNRLLGRWGESLVAEYLRKRKWEIIGAGYHCRMGEIDLIAVNRQYIAFVEVKLRKSDAYGSAAEAVNTAKQKRLQATAQLYLASHPDLLQLQPRFDVAEVYAPQGLETAKPRIVYMENAF